MLSYQELQSIYHRERKTPVLQRLPDDFYRSITVLLAESEERHREHIKKLAADVVSRRQHKILLAALRTDEKTPENLLKDEEELLKNAYALLSTHRKRILAPSMPSARSKTPEPARPKINVSVKIIRPLPEVADEEQTYGPYKEGDVASLPESIAALLLSKGAAEAHNPVPSTI
ncbi:Uncharacterised protein [uncultured archaeon]|nr:Uncharacterised protein [uncultured archaeon]